MHQYSILRFDELTNLAIRISEKLLLQIEQHFLNEVNEVKWSEYNFNFKM